MTEGNTASEAEMIIAFLQAEIDSPRFSAHITPFFEGTGLAPNDLIAHADTANECQNALRRSILRAYRGYGRDDLLFRWFPADVIWRRVQIEPQDHPRLLFAKEPGWTSLSDGTRRVKVLAEKIAAGQVPQDAAAQEAAANVTAIQQALGRGVTFPELIGVQADDDNSLVLVEDHSRATAYVGLKWNKNIEMRTDANAQLAGSLLPAKPLRRSLAIGVGPGETSLPGRRHYPFQTPVGAVRNAYRPRVGEFRPRSRQGGLVTVYQRGRNRWAARYRKLKAGIARIGLYQSMCFGTEPNRCAWSDGQMATFRERD